MNKYFFTFIKAILAGIFIGLAAVVYCFVSGTSTILASCLFAFALLTILELRFALFTGKVGFLNKTNWLHILITLIGNIIGVFLVATLLHYTQYGVVLYEICARICTVKLSGSLLSTLILSFFCGFLMHTAVICKIDISDSIKYLLIILCVVIFIQSFYEHVIANLFYFIMSKQIFTLQGARSIIVMLIGNTLGAKFMNFLYEHKGE